MIKNAACWRRVAEMRLALLNQQNADLPGELAAALPPEPERIHFRV